MGNKEGLLLALMGTGFTFLATTLGASAVFFFRQHISKNTERIFLGFAAGIMIAASIWSLLIPALEMTECKSHFKFIPVTIGFLFGIFFLLLLDNIIPHLHYHSKKPEGMHTSFKRTTMLFLAVTLHNIPEGMAVALTFSLASGGHPILTFSSALALAIGIGLQNIPEGAALSLPLKGEGISTFKAFLYGSLSGIVEPIAGIIAVLLASSITPLMPWLLSFAAGAMMYVVVEELIPEAHLGEHSHSGTISVMIGFLVMMILDITLG